MDKTKPHQTLSGRPIAKKVVARMKLSARGKIINIKNVIRGRAMAKQLQKTVVSQQELAGLHPAHAAYVYAQNQVSVLSEQLTALKEMARFADIISKAEDLYMPSAPPNEPLDHVLLYLLGILRCLCGARQRDHRHHHLGGRRSLRNAP
jgi:hypothetical protein